MVLKSILREELENSINLKKRYEGELRALPKGHLSAKRIKGHLYYYIMSRQKGKVKSVYKGKMDKVEIAKYGQIKKDKAKYRNLLSKVKKQIVFLRKALRGKEEV
jgi:hypothetical protein